MSSSLKPSIKDEHLASILFFFYYFNGVLAHMRENGMLYDLGLELSQIKNVTVVEEKIKEIDDNFDLVLIMERYNIFLFLCVHLVFLFLFKAAILKILHYIL